MCNGYNHSNWCTCGWGGDGHSGGRSGGNSPNQDYNYDLLSWSIGHARCDLRSPFTHPIYCHYCGVVIFFHTNGNGDCVFFDELGPPWPKHSCLQSKASIQAAERSDDLMKLVGVITPPSQILPPRGFKLQAFKAETVGAIITGVILSTKLQNVWRSQPGKVSRQAVQVWSTIILLNKTLTLRLHTDVSCPLPIGQIIKATLGRDNLDGKNVFYIECYEVEVAPQDVP